MKWELIFTINGGIGILDKKKKGIKLNVGASPIWEKEGWTVVDHKITKNRPGFVKGDATNINLEDNSCSIIFTSHMFEHIPHYKIQKTILELSRVLEIGGTIRILTPDLKKIAKAYVEEDEDIFKEALKEDENVRKDLGLGGIFMNFIISPGQDTILLNRNMSEFIGGYAHLYCYDFEMLKILLEQCGFGSIEQKKFCESNIEELKEPLRVVGFENKWQNLNKKFYKDNNLIHEYKDGKYNINFKVTGFDRDPLTSLIIEAKKERDINPKNIKDINGEDVENYNRYGFSLLYDKEVKKKLSYLGIKISNRC